MYRTSSNHISMFDICKRAYYYIEGCFLVQFLIIMFYIIKNMKKMYISKKVVNLIPFIVLGIMPIICFFLLKQHSYQHMFFSYRNIILLLISIPLVLINIVKKK